MESLALMLPYLLSALVGLMLGSFANVVIWRVPRGESIASPGSHCPGCGAPVRWHDNVPILSWLILRGRCRDCRTPISSRYPLVEAASGVLWVAAVVTFGFEPAAAVAGIFLWTLLVLTLIDLDTMRLPNPIVATLGAIGVAAVGLSQVTGVTLAPLIGGAYSPVVSAGIGILAGAGSSGSVAALYAVVRGRSGFGMGDVKLLGVMGIFLGPYVLLALVVGSFAGALVGVVAAARSTDGMAAKIPFGPFLALGSAVVLFWGPGLLAWYTSLVGIG